MKPLVTFDSVSLEANGPSLTVRLGPGRALGVFGPAASGKSRFLEIVRGTHRPGRGKVVASEPMALAEVPNPLGRTTPASLATKVADRLGANRVAEVLAALRLWDVRRTPLVQLGSGHLDACRLIEPLASPNRLIVIDEALDRLDPWAFHGAIELLAQRLLDGSALILASNRPELCARMDTLVVLNGRNIRFAGTLADLERMFPSNEITVETRDQTGVRAIAAPFEFRMAETDEGVVLTTGEGQKLAAKLLLEGYGDVKSVVLKKPSAAHLLQRLF